MSEHDKIIVNNQQLIRRCSGFRTKMFVKVYELTMYTKKLHENMDDIIVGNNVFLIELKFLMNIPNDKIKQSMYDGFHDNNSKEELNTFQNDIDSFLSIFDNILLVKNDILCINYDGINVNIRLTTQDGLKEMIINKDQFKNPLLKIWIGNKPVDKHLKNALIKGIIC